MLNRSSGCLSKPVSRVSPVSPTSVAPPLPPLHPLARWGASVLVLLGLGWGLEAVLALPQRAATFVGEVRMDMLMVGGARAGEAGMASRTAPSSHAAASKDTASQKPASQKTVSQDPTKNSNIPSDSSMRPAVPDAVALTVSGQQHPPSAEQAPKPAGEAEPALHRDAKVALPQEPPRQAARQVGQRNAPTATLAGKAQNPAVAMVSVEMLDAGFRLLKARRLVYPPAAFNLRRSGEVLLEIEVDSRGKATQVRVLKETGEWGFGRSAKSAFAQAHFTPPTRKGKPVRVRWRKTLVFKP